MVKSFKKFSHLICPAYNVFAPMQFFVQQRNQAYGAISSDGRQNCWQLVWWLFLDPEADPYPINLSFQRWPWYLKVCSLTMISQVLDACSKCCLTKKILKLQLSGYLWEETTCWFPSQIDSIAFPCHDVITFTHHLKYHTRVVNNKWYKPTYKWISWFCCYWKSDM